MLKHWGKMVVACLLGFPVYSQTLTWGYFDFPPYFSEDAVGQPEGILAELVACVTIAEHVNVEAKYLPNRRAAMMLATEDINFAVTIPTFLPEPANYLISPEPVAHIELMAYWLGDKPAVTQWQDLLNQKIITLAGYSYMSGREFLNANEHALTIMAEVENHERGLQSLLKQRGDYFIGYHGPARQAINLLDITELHFSHMGSYPVHFNLRKSTPDAQQIMQKLMRGFHQCADRFPALAGRASH
ncbi:substrate-binding periplasmic protein [Alteromonas sp. CYL-A6]|uniref:substrate-binding periplasmic protein n=1 Tax=Alteromonas nitratireducens TaxID=3390813 RepID=UPI0034AF8FCA